MLPYSTWLSSVVRFAFRVFSMLGCGSPDPLQKPIALKVGRTCCRPTTRDAAASHKSYRRLTAPQALRFSFMAPVSGSIPWVGDSQCEDKLRFLSRI